jgi:SAM-dependent methyltransferase
MTHAQGRPRLRSEDDGDFAEYDAAETVARYRRSTAGEGINYLLPRVYGPIFISAARAAAAETGAKRLRIVEFGCGAAMALHFLTEALLAEGTDVELAVGADFVPRMVEGASLDVAEYGSETARERMRFAVASNEELAAGLAEAFDTSVDALAGTFHLAIGVNTFRYPIRHGTAAAAVEQLHRLLAPGGRVVVIDMNDRFPYGVKPKRRLPGQTGRLPFRLGNAPLPSLEGYARPLAEGGFEVLERRKCCWIPHSACGVRFRLAKATEPVLDRLVPDRAMRSIVVARRR